MVGVLVAVTPVAPVPLEVAVELGLSPPLDVDDALLVAGASQSPLIDVRFIPCVISISFVPQFTY